MISQLLVVVSVAGGLFMVTSAVLGLLRFPDVYCRTHAVTKAGTVGVALIVLAAAFFHGEATGLARGLLTVLFVFATAPVSAQMIGRAAYLAGAPMSERTTSDHIAEDYPDRSELFASGGERGPDR